MLTVEAQAILDNPAWHALVGRQSFCAKGDDKARWYDPEYTKLAGVREKTKQCFEALYEQLPPGQVVVLAARPPLPAGWSDGFEVLDNFYGTQMVCERLAEPDLQYEHELVELTADDVPEMTALVELTRPGPFGPKTIEFGTFLGIKRGGRLIAMAGERIKPGANFDEVSAVCTHPDFQGQGMARVLVQEVSKGILNRGHVPFLHVRTENAAGIKSYTRVGFQHRTDINFIVLRRT